MIVAFSIFSVKINQKFYAQFSRCQQQQRVVVNGLNHNNNNLATSLTAQATSIPGGGSSSSSSPIQQQKQPSASFSGSLAQVATSAIIPEDVDYRSLRESNDYRSILPDDCDDNDYLLPIQRVPNHSNSTIE